MPHIELRVSPNIADQVNGQELLACLVAKLATFETVNPAALKGYQVQLLAYQMGEGAADGFIHVTASVLSGRPVDLRRKMAEALFEIVKAEAGRLGVGASIELREMDKDTYIK